MSLLSLNFKYFILILFMSSCRTVKSSVFFKCDKDGGGEYEFITIPENFMSNFETTVFRVELPPLSIHECDKTYEIIQINLIGSADSNTRINSSPSTTPTTPTSVPGQYEDNDLGGDNSTFPYDPFVLSQRKNGSKSERFMFAIENMTTAISDTGYLLEKEEYEAQLQCERKLSRKEVHFTSSGFLFYYGEYYWNTEFCIKSFNKDENTMIIRKCNVNCNSKFTPCISLCCHLDEYLDLKVPCCQATDSTSKPMFHPVIYTEINRRLFSEEAIYSTNASMKDKQRNSVRNGVKPHYITFKYLDSCPDGMAPHYLFFNHHNGESTLDTKIYIQNTGKLAYLGEGRQWNFLKNFCVSGIVNTEEYVDEIDGMGQMNSVIYYCPDEDTPDPGGSTWYYYVYIGAFGFSTVFLMFTVIVYLLLWDKQNIHGWTILSFVVSEFALFLLLSISYSFSQFTVDDEAPKSVYCVGSAIFAHFFFLSTFCWLTIINLDLWWTFKSLTPLSERSKGKKRFLFYMAFAWGIPIVIIVTGLVLQHVYRNRDSFVIVPDYGERRCFLARHAEGVYLYYIIGTLLLANFILITCTFVTIYKFKKSTRVASSSSSRAKEHSFKLFVKLVMVMGVTWSLEFILWLQAGNETISWLLIAADVFNILQAIATFAIFVCKRKILNQLEQKHPALKFATRPILKIMAGRSSTLVTSTDSKPTRSTTAGSTSMARGSRKAVAVKSSSLADSKL